MVRQLNPIQNFETMKTGLFFNVKNLFLHLQYFLSK